MSNVIKRRFLSRCRSYNVRINGKDIAIDSRRGYTTEDEAEIAFITGHSDFNNMVFEVPTIEALQAENREAAVNILAKLAAPPAPVAPIPVEPLTPVDVEDEQKKLAAEEEERRRAEEEEIAREAEANAEAELLAKNRLPWPKPALPKRRKK